MATIMVMVRDIRTMVIMATTGTITPFRISRSRFFSICLSA